MPFKTLTGSTSLQICAVGLLFALAAAGEAHALFDVRRFGAKGDGTTLDTAALNQAVDACHRAGGGTVLVPSGVYLTGTVQLKSNVTLFLEAGAVLRGSRELKHYETTVPEDRWFASLIQAKKARKLAVMGRGVIDGAKVFDPNGEERMRGPHALLFEDCEDILIRDVAFRDAANFAVVLQSSQNANVDGITVLGGWDGIHLRDSRDVTIANCRFFTGDDCLSGFLWKNVTVTNCILNTSCSGFRAGGRDIHISNLLISGPGKFEHRTSGRHNFETAFRLWPHVNHPSKTGPFVVRRKLMPMEPIDNIVLSNITVVNPRAPLWIDPGPSGEGLGRIYVRGLTVTGAGKGAMYFAGNAARPIQSVVLENVDIQYEGGVDEGQLRDQGIGIYSIMPSQGLEATHVENLVLSNVRISALKPDVRPGLIANAVGALQINSSLLPPGIVAGKVGRLLVDGKERPASESVPLPKIERRAPEIGNGAQPAPPWKVFSNTRSEARQHGDELYVRAVNEGLLERWDEYAAVYREAALTSQGVVEVGLRNPDRRSGWAGRAGIIVRNKIDEAGKSAGYVVLAVSPGNGCALQWDADGDGRIDSHTEYGGYTYWPSYLRLRREGNRYSGYYSRDRVHWTEVGQIGAPGANAVQDAGIFVTGSSASFFGFELTARSR